MPAAHPSLSLIVPTRNRPVPLRRFLDSVAATATNPECLEIVLIVDDDDPDSHIIRHPRLRITTRIGASGRTMGALNTAGYQASTGEYVMLLNDDVIVRTRGWDRTVLKAAHRFPDGIVLVHVNDTLIKDYLCTFPLVSRKFCEWAGGICPVEYERYRIDDHIEDIFNMLAAGGTKRTIYLPDVIFEHTNAVEHPQAGRVYLSDMEILARDAPRFDSLLPQRKELARQLLEFIQGEPVSTAQRKLLSEITDPFALRIPGRQLVVRAPYWKRLPGIMARSIQRLRGCYDRGGVCGLLRALARRVTLQKTITAG